MPYAEPTWLTPVFKSPYYKDSHRELQKGETCSPPPDMRTEPAAMRKFIDEVIYPDAQACEESGKRASKEVLQAMA